MMETHKEKPAPPPECGPDSVQGAEATPPPHRLANAERLKLPLLGYVLNTHTHAKAFSAAKKTIHSEPLPVGHYYRSSHSRASHPEFQHQQASNEVRRDPTDGIGHRLV
jgi:hypothetical protein